MPDGVFKLMVDNWSGKPWGLIKEKDLSVVLVFVKMS